MTEALTLRDVDRRFGGLKAVDSVSMTVSEGEIFGIIGPNGAGKTTLFNLISGNVSTMSGAIELYGRRIERMPVHRRARLGLGRTFQTSQLFAGVTVHENLEIAEVSSRRGVGGWLGSPTARRTVEAERVDLEAWDLADKGERLAGELTLFEQQRLALAMTLAAGARVLLLDEPSGGLVESEVHQLMELIRGIRDRGVTVLVIDHKMRLMMQLCDRIMVMALGAVITTGDPTEIAADARVRELYFGRAPVRGVERNERTGGPDPADAHTWRAGPTS